MKNIESAVLRKIENVGDGVFSIDTDFLRARQDASHLIVDSGRAAFVDTGTNFSVPTLQAAVRAQGLAAEDVEYIFLTHVHLDHAGGAGLLAQVFAHAEVVVHPRGAGHLIDPAKLIAGTRAVYGDAAFERMYGDIQPIPKERLGVVQDGDSRQLGRRRFEFLHTPGHALHHVCIVEREAGIVFSGDTFGVSYREFDNAGGEFVMPTTTPTQFDPEQLHLSVARILQLQPSRVYMTHYSGVDAISRLGAELHADIDRYVAIATEHATHADRQARICQDIEEHTWARLQAHEFQGSDAQIHALLDDDVRLNAAGLVAWLARRMS